MNEESEVLLKETFPLCYKFVGVAANTYIFLPFYLHWFLFSLYVKKKSLAVKIIS